MSYHSYFLPIEEAPVVMPYWYQLTELSTIPPEAPVIDTSRLCIEMFIDDDQGIFLHFISNI